MLVFPDTLSMTDLVKRYHKILSELRAIQKVDDEEKAVINA